MGYHRCFPDAEIIGVDVKSQPRYPFTFVHGDAMDYPLDGFDLIHASPPCHDHTRVAGKARKEGTRFGTKWMLEATIDRLLDVDVPWFVENVLGTQRYMDAAPYKIMLCGSMFGLDLRRHRWFAMRDDLDQPACDHGWQTPRFRSLMWERYQAGKLSPVVGVHGKLNYPGEFPLRCAAMGIDWMTNREIIQAVPPAFTEWIGGQL